MRIKDERKNWRTSIKTVIKSDSMRTNISHAVKSERDDRATESDLKIWGIDQPKRKELPDVRNSSRIHRNWKESRPWNKLRE